MTEQSTGATLAPRRDRVGQLKDAIGWSWIGLGTQLGWTSAQLHQFKTCKRPIADHDLDWLETLAAFHVDNPRPDAPRGTPAVVRDRETLTMQVPVEPKMVATVETAAAAAAAAADYYPRDALAYVIAQAYQAAAMRGDLSTEELTGARWALGDLAERLKLKPAVMAEIKALAGNMAGVPAADVASAPAAPPWQPAAGSTVPAPVNRQREPFPVERAGELEPAGLRASF